MEAEHESSHGRTEEEDDLLRQSIKRVREESVGPPVINEEGRISEIQNMSFEDRLLGFSSTQVEYDIDDEILEDDEGDMDSEDDLYCPTIRVTKKEKRRLRKPWRLSLIINLMGRLIGYKTLLQKITVLWRPKASLDLVAMDNGFFLMKFSSVDDCEFAKCGGPWLIFDHYLTVRPRRPNFDTKQDELNG